MQLYKINLAFDGKEQVMKMEAIREDKLLITVQTDIDEYNGKLDKFNPLICPLVLKADKIDNGWYFLMYGEHFLWYGTLGEINVAVKTLLKMREIQDKIEGEVHI